MKEFVEKLIGRLEECKKKEKCNLYSGIEEGFGYSHCSDAFEDGQTLGAFNAYSSMLDFIKELAEEYNNGWIPVSERFPSKEEYLKNDGRFIVTDGNRCYQSVFDIYSQKFRTSIFTTFGSYKYEEDKCVIAWQPLPAPFKKGE